MSERKYKQFCWKSTECGKEVIGCVDEDGRPWQTHDELAARMKWEPLECIPAIALWIHGMEAAPYLSSLLHERSLQQE